MAWRRTLAAALFFLASMGAAHACRGQHWESSIVLGDLTGIDAPVAMHVTITQMLNDLPQSGEQVPQDQYVKRHTQIGLARVEKVIRGDFRESFVQIAVLPTSCGPFIQVGLSGIVAGQIERGADGVAVLKPIAESDATRQTRLKKSSGR